MNIYTRKMIESGVAKRIVRAALAAKLVVSVHDGESWPVIRSDKFTDIVKALFSVDQESIVLRHASGEYVGSVLLVYGNDGFDVIADHTDSPEMSALLRDAVSYIDQCVFAHC